MQWQVRLWTLAATIALAGCSSSGNDNDEQPIQTAGASGTSTGGTGTPDGGEPATGGSTGTAGTGGTQAPMCVEFGEDCSADPQSCCNGTTCVYDVDTPTQGRCATNCTDGSDCNSGCCSELIDAPGAVCAPPGYCANTCLPAGEGCDGLPDYCCTGTICVVDPTVTVCAAKCTSGAECNSGCCAPLDDPPDTFVCSPPEFCL